MGASSSVFREFKELSMIKDGAKVSIAFQLKDEEGNIWDEHTKEAPFTYTQGKHQLMSFIENALLGKQQGERISLDIPPDQGYGQRDDKLISTLPRAHFKEVKALSKGMRFNPSLDPNISFMVVDFDDDTVTVDANHPLAGKTLTFEIEILQIR